MRNKAQLKLTSVKVLKELYFGFKRDTTETEFTLQKLVNRSLYLYQNDDKFRRMIDKAEQLKEEHKCNTL
jgi:hypothetical protein